MAVAWDLVKRLTGKAYRWAVRNIKKVWHWMLDGQSERWIVKKINEILDN